MKLFDRLWRSAPTCTHSKSTAVRSEIGHNTVRRYYWFCGRCGEKVYIQDWKGNAHGVPGAPSHRAITRLHNAVTS
jgi:phage terminase large subunit GpA-like protein